jgi:uncharacterized protein YrzB (UPF0473 family)
VKIRTFGIVEDVSQFTLGGYTMDKDKLHDCGCDEELEACGCSLEDEDCGCEDENCGCDDEGCGCGCGHEHDHETLVVDLEDENGNIVQCEVVDGFEFKDNEYILVQNPSDGSIYLFKVVGEGENSELVIPDDEEFKEVSAYYESSLDEE